MKYPEEMYIDSQIFAGDMDGSESNLTEKVVKIRNSHLCCVCEKQIPKGERMLNQKAIVEGQGWCSCYICYHVLKTGQKNQDKYRRYRTYERNFFQGKAER